MVILIGLGKLNFLFKSFLQAEGTFLEISKRTFYNHFHCINFIKKGDIKMLNWLPSLLNKFSEKCHDVGTIIFLPIMTILIALNVILRYVFNAPLSWGEEMNGLLLFLTLFLSITYAWDQNRHIRMEIVYVKLKGKLRRFADFVTGITGIIFFGLMGVQCIRDVPYMIKTRETGEELGIPLWPFRIIMALISIVFVLKLLIYIFSYKKIDQEKKKIEREGIMIHKEKA